MKVWLEPIQHPIQMQNPFPAVLSRMDHELSETMGERFQNHDFRRLMANAPYLTMNLTQFRMEDTNQYSQEVIRQADILASWPRDLDNVVEQLDLIFENELQQKTPDNPHIEWSIALLDPEFYLSQIENFVNTFKRCPWLKIYLVTDNERLFTRINNVEIISENALRELVEYQGFPPDFKAYEDEEQEEYHDDLEHAWEEIENRRKKLKPIPKLDPPINIGNVMGDIPLSPIEPGNFEDILNQRQIRKNNHGN